MSGYDERASKLAALAELADFVPRQMNVSTSGFVAENINLRHLGVVIPALHDDDDLRAHLCAQKFL
jgi:hypothetical protein